MLGRGGQVVGQRRRFAVGRGETGPERGVAMKAGREVLALAPQRLSQPGTPLPGVVPGDESVVGLQDLALDHVLDNREEAWVLTANPACEGAAGHRYPDGIPTG